MIKRLKKLASVFKPNRFHFALVDYLAEELKSNNISCRKKTSYIKIKLASTIEEKYDHLVIDCFNGGIYLRGNEVRDKKIFKLNRFYGDREADAMHCARGGAKSVIKLLGKLQNQDSMIVEANDLDNYNYEEKIANLTDMRKIANKTKDMRKIAKKILKDFRKILARDIDDRDKQGAICYINGEIYEGIMHCDCMEKYLENHDKKSIKQIAFAHKVSEDNSIYIEQDTLEDVDLNTVANTLKIKYPNYNICIDENNLKIAKICRLKKKADVNGRDFAIAIVNGEIFSGDTHGEAITKYLKKIGVDDVSVYDRDELENIMGYGFKSQFAAAHAKGDTIYLEPETLENISMEQAANLIKDKYPGYQIINVDTNERIAKLKKISSHSDSSRDMAVCYINGYFYEGDTHAECIDKYLEEYYNKNLNDKYYRPDSSNSSDKNQKDNQLIDEYIKQMAFAHLLEYEKTIYIEEHTLQNISINTAGNLFKEQYPDYDIYNDDSYKGNGNCDDDYDEDGNNKYEKIARLKKVATDIEDRDFEGAIVYIDGEVYTARTHATAINNYIQEKLNQELSNTWSRPNLKNNDNSFLSEERIKDKELIKNNIKQLGFAHKISKLSDVDGDEDIILVEQNSLYNVDLNTVVNAIKNKYPDFNIYIDETDEKVAKKVIDLRAIKVSRLKKIAWHDVSDRDAALAYIDGEVVEADTHALCVDKYLKEYTNTSLNEQQIRPNINIEVDDAWDDNQAQDLQNIYDNIKQICFGHIDRTNKMIYLEPNGLNVSVNDLTTIGPKIKEKFPDFNIVIDNAANTDFQRVAIIKKSRLKKLSGFHDKRNRTSAIMYLDGEVLEGPDHYDMITQYMKEKYNLDRTNSELERETDKLFDSLPYAMGSKVDEDKAIYIDDDTLNDVDEQTVISAIKAKYPDYNVEIETASNEDMREYYKKYMSEEEYNEYLKLVSNY